ncbi:helix-turn-helix transcriptional regulator [Uniformispora flossi]|uniref:PadR family transcriptional regulator n=1 Tax=Uniformispora flossi TaxID=3390723 RepID=UPI003C2CFC53
MTPVFGHGRLRLYLLKLLDESPRHGYEIIRLLQDRFLGLYAPSAGTVYPRLAKLEQEGLVTHSVEGGRKVYRITEAGRAELAERQPELDALESEIRDSVYERAREIRDEVRTSARNLREELRQATREMRDTPQDAPGTPGADRGSAASGGAGKDDPVSAWAKNIGPALSQKMVDLAEGLAQGLAGLTEHHAQHLEEELRRRFGPEGPGDGRGGKAATATGKPTGTTTGKTAGQPAGKTAGKSAAKPAPATAGTDDPWRAETDPATDHGTTPAADSPAGESGKAGKTGQSEKTGKSAPGLDELGRLFDRFRTEIDTAAGCAGLTPSQVDRARDVLVRAYTELSDIVNDR